MPEINLIMNLPDFSQYIEDILEKSGGILLVEYKVDGDIHLKRVIPGELSEIDKNRETHLRFYILSRPIDDVSEIDIFDDELSEIALDGEGGRETEDSIERISLRMISKNPHKDISRIFKLIKAKLNADDEIGKGLKGSSKWHATFFYKKIYADTKLIRTDIHNDRSPKLVA
jgi:hypothetical protein